MLFEIFLGVMFLTSFIFHVRRKQLDSYIVLQEDKLDESLQSMPEAILLDEIQDEEDDVTRENKFFRSKLFGKFFYQLWDKTLNSRKVFFFI